MSTTSHKSIAVQYTGIAKGRCFPTLLQVLQPSPLIFEAS
jgi:hypothetical protein